MTRTNGAVNSDKTNQSNIEHNKITRYSSFKVAQNEHQDINSTINYQNDSIKTINLTNRFVLQNVE
jgi:hypothetical protein